MALLPASLYVDELGEFASASHASTLVLPTPLHSLVAGSAQFPPSLLVAPAAATNGARPPTGAVALVGRRAN